MGDQIVARYGLHEKNESGYSILKEKYYKLDKENDKNGFNHHCLGKDPRTRDYNLKRPKKDYIKLAN